MSGEMITKLLNSLFAQTSSIHPRSAFQTRSEWQSEFLFVPAKPTIRYDSQRRPMTVALIDPTSKNPKHRAL